ncbi:MAG: hypothetical protein KUG77_18310 [Nannocystaceae bacterium]|nr:hypothetical protein [Nannocystaceae bacterium]
MRLEAPPIIPSLRPFRNHGIVDEHAITLRIRPLRWRDRVLPDVLRWAGATATIAAVAGASVFFASPSEAARIETYRGGTEPIMAPMTMATPALDQVRFTAAPETGNAAGSLEDEEEDAIIIIEDEEDDDEILIFDNSLDGPSAAAMAVLHIERNEHALAVQYALEAVEAAPRNPAHQRLLGQAHRLSGDRRAARVAFRRARRLRH